MIARIKGKIIEKEDKALVVETSGIGWRVVVAKDVREKIVVGDEIELRTYHHVTNDAQELFGFVEAEGLQYFRLLLTVPTVGPRTAMNILDVAPPSVLAQAVAEDDVIVLTGVAGVGKKTAQRIVTELKGKIATPKTKGMPGALQQEVIEALVSLGYSVGQARKAVSALAPDVMNVEDAVRTILREQQR